jgi:hypothetical protein
MKWLVFSDTILLTLEIPPCLDIEKVAYFCLFLTQCSILWEEMFKVGLPLRGVLGYGQFVVHEACFAGEPIIKAYELASQLNFAGCVLSDAAASWVDALLNKGSLRSEPAYAKYSVPLNHNGSQVMSVLNVMVHVTPAELGTVDFQQWVRDSFIAHRKEITEEKERSKVINTVACLTFLRELQKNAKGFLTPGIASA